MTTTSSPRAVATEQLRGIRGALLWPDDEDYDQARAAWNRNARQRPAVVVMAESAADVAPRCGSRATRSSGSP